MTDNNTQASQHRHNPILPVVLCAFVLSFQCFPQGSSFGRGRSALVGPAHVCHPMAYQKDETERCKASKDLDKRSKDSKGGWVASAYSSSRPPNGSFLEESVPAGSTLRDLREHPLLSQPGRNPEGNNAGVLTHRQPHQM